MLNLITYNEAVALTIGSDATFYESKFVVDGYNISIFNYRLAQYSDFKVNSAFEMRGLTFVFNKDGSLYKRYILLHKFFNLNQVEESQYSLIKDLEIKSISNKEDGSVASFIRLPNGRVIAKSKMSFDSNQAIGMMRLYNSNKELREFINFTLDNDLVAVFEYVAPDNRIVLRYNKEELILLRLRDNNTGEYLDLTNYLKEIGSIRVAPSEVLTLDKVIELVNNVEDKEGWIIQFTNGLFIKIKTDWYFRLHGLLTNDICRENIIIGYVLDDLIDDIIAQIPEDEVESHDRINKIISIVKSSISDVVNKINGDYDEFVNSAMSKKEYALINNKVGNPFFHFVMSVDKSNRLKKMSKEEILDVYNDWGYYEFILKRCQPFEMAKEFIREKTKRLECARDWLITKDSTLSFLDGDLEGDD